MTSNEEKAFLSAIEAEPNNYQLRYIYADWLDENGDHEEADRQRKYEHSLMRLRQIAIDNELGWVETLESLERAEESPDGYERWEQGYVRKEDDQYAYESNPLVQLLYFLERHLESDSFYLPFETPYGFQYSEEMWQCYEIVTGKPSPKNQYRSEMPPFRCSC